MYDAEEYLRSAAAEGGNTQEAIAGAIDAYGTPAEIAAAYSETERTVVAALRRPVPVRSTNPVARFFGVIADPGAWGGFFYMLLSPLTGIPYFTVVVTGLATSLWLAAAPIVQVVLGTPVVRTLQYAYYIEPWGTPLMVAGGALGFFLTLWVAKGVGFLHGQFAKALLVGRCEGGER